MASFCPTINNRLAVSASANGKSLSIDRPSLNLPRPSASDLSIPLVSPLLPCNGKHFWESILLPPASSGFLLASSICASLPAAHRIARRRPPSLLPSTLRSLFHAHAEHAKCRRGTCDARNVRVCMLHRCSKNTYNILTERHRRLFLRPTYSLQWFDGKTRSAKLLRARICRFHRLHERELASMHYRAFVRSFVRFVVNGADHGNSRVIEGRPGASSTYYITLRGVARAVPCYY